jgi:hypothetical protein
VLLAVRILKTSNRILAATALLWWAIRGNSGGNRGAAAHCRTVAPNPCAKPHNVAMGSTLIEARMDRSASSDCSFLKKRRVERNPVRGDTFLDDVVKIFEIETQRRILLHGGDELLRRCNRAKLPLTRTKLHASSGEEKRRRAHRRFRSSSATWLKGSRPISRSAGGACDPGGGRRWPQFRCPGLLRLAD